MSTVSVKKVSMVTSALYGAIAGLVAGIVMAVAGYVNPVPMMNSMPFFIAAVHHLKINSPDVATGWGLHIFTSLVIGVIFGVLTAGMAILRTTSVLKGAVLGVVVGVITYCLLFLPIIPGIMTSLWSMSDFMVESFGQNILFGLVLGGVFSILYLMRVHKP